MRLCVGVDKSNILVMIISKTVLVIFTLIYSVLILKVKSIMILFLLMYLWYLYIIEEKKFYLYEKTRRAIKNIIINIIAYMVKTILFLFILNTTLLNLYIDYY